MATDYVHRIASSTIAIGTAVAGVVAQAAPDTSVGQIGAGGVMMGVTYLVIMLVREASPPLLRWAEIQATARNERVRMEEIVRHMTAKADADAARIADLESRVAAAEQEARDAKNLVENEKIVAEARAAAIEQRAREAGHLARNNAQRIQNVEQTLASGSGDRDPESVI